MSDVGHLSISTPAVATRCVLPQARTKRRVLATSLNDFSLIESLILTPRGDAIQYPSLLAAATVLVEEAKQMRRVLRNSGLIGRA